MNITDTLERSALTFAEAFLATIVVTDLSSVRGAALAGTAALVAFLKSVVVQLRRNGETSLL